MMRISLPAALGLVGLPGPRWSVVLKSGLFCLVVSIAWSWAPPAWAVPLQFVQQGRLLGVDDQPLDGTYDLSFALYDHAIAGALQWSEAHVLVFDSGYYSAPLGSVTALEADLFAGGPLWLELAVDGVVLEPRQQVASVPWALRALSADGVEGGSVNADEVSISGQPVIDSTGSWVGPTFPVNWSELSGIPPEIADGDQDTDTLSTLFCVEGEVAKWAAGSWYCAPDIDTDTNTQLSASEVEGFVTSGPIDLATGSTLNGAVIATGAHIVDTDTLVTLNCSDGESATWSDSQQSWSCAPNSDSLAALACASGQIVRWESSASGWVCGDDIDTVDANTDTLADLSCLDGEIARFDQASGLWGCDQETSFVRQSFHVHKNGSSQSGVLQGGVTRVTWPAEFFDTGQSFDSDRFTCSVGGKYSFYAVVKFTSLGLYDSEVRLHRNGLIAAYSNYFLSYDSGQNVGAPSMMVSSVLDLSPGDYVEVYVHQEGGADTIDGASYATYFTGHRVDN